MLRAVPTVGKSIRRQHFLRLVDHLIPTLPHDDGYLVLDCAHSLPVELIPEEGLRWFAAALVEFVLGRPTDFELSYPECAEWVEEWLREWGCWPG